MRKAGGIVAIIAGIFGVMAALVTLLFGGIGAAVDASSSDTVIWLGFGGVLFSFLVIIFGALAINAKSKLMGLALLVCSAAGIILGGTFVAIFMLLSLAGGVLVLLGVRQANQVGAA